MLRFNPKINTKSRQIEAMNYIENKKFPNETKDCLRIQPRPHPLLQPTILALSIKFTFIDSSRRILALVVSAARTMNPHSMQ